MGKCRKFTEEFKREAVALLRWEWWEVRLRRTSKSHLSLSAGRLRKNDGDLSRMLEVSLPPVTTLVIGRMVETPPSASFPV